MGARARIRVWRRPDEIFLAGNSAGGHMAAMAALTPNDPKFQPGFESVDTSVTAVICQCGYYGYIDKKSGAPSSPWHTVEKTHRRSLWHMVIRTGYVPVENARLFAEHLRDSSTNPVVYVELPGAEHNFDLFHSIRTEAVVHGIEAFAAWGLVNNKHN